jgi:hypothetical protein
MSWACSTYVVNKKCVQNCELEVEGKWGKLLVEDINDLLMSAEEPFNVGVCFVS